MKIDYTRTYRVIEASSVANLVAAVNDALEAGWVIEGGIAVAPNLLFYQAMSAFKIDLEMREQGGWGYMGDVTTDEDRA